MELANMLKALCDSQVEFVIVDGVSATLHGSAQVTFDLDVCYSRSTANLRHLARALSPFHRPRGFPADLPFIWDVRTLQNGSLFTLTSDLGDIDLLGEVTGLGIYEDAKAKSVPMHVHGYDVYTLDLRSLIAAKRAAGREKDLRTLPELESLLEAEEA